MQLQNFMHSLRMEFQAPLHPRLHTQAVNSIFVLRNWVYALLDSVAAPKNAHCNEKVFVQRFNTG